MSFLVNENINLSIGSATPSSPPKGKVFAPCWSENGYRLCSFWSGIVYGVRAEVAWDQAGVMGKKGKKRGQIGKLSASDASPAVVWGGEKGDHPFPSTDYRLSSLASRFYFVLFCFFVFAHADYFSFLPQYGACPQAKLRKIRERMN